MSRDDIGATFLLLVLIVIACGESGRCSVRAGVDDQGCSASCESDGGAPGPGAVPSGGPRPEQY